MKKLFIAACMMLGFTGAFAQAAAKKETPKATEMKAVKTPETRPAKVVKMQKATEDPAAAPVKKDGTPDKRFKANKEKAAAPEGPVKKDGTADKRYKANK